MERRVLTVCLVVGVILFNGVLIASAGESPLADAGLDQEVSKGTTVLLDGTGSRDPDGSIDTYQWRIDSPSNSVTAPECLNCARTQFTPTEVGRYNVTLEVTDEDGKTSTDTLYVTVEPGAGPNVTISGKQNPRVGNTATYTATVESGVADLDRVEWYLDGQRFKTESAAGDHDRSSVSQAFGNSAKHTLTVVAYDVDGQRDSTFVPLSVQESLKRQSIASRVTPEIWGNNLVTGARPLDERYTIDHDAAESNIDSVEWHGQTTIRGTGLRQLVTWSPGAHEFYAIVTYIDGSNDVARFSDGSTTVVADPKPALTVKNLTHRGSIQGTAIATDGYENLDQLTVEVNGTTIQTVELNPYQRRLFGMGDTLERSFEYESITPGQQYEVTVTATDTRGQTTSLTKVVTPTGYPEIVRSEFVNGPVDSYHPRINESRYTAHHVLEIDLNGVNRKNIEVIESPLIPSKVKKVYKKDNLVQPSNGEDSNLTIHSYWAGQKPGEYQIDVGWETDIPLESEYNKRELKRDIFKVTPSKPELRYSVVNDGTIHSKRDWGIVVDASESFDPDGTSLKYIWKNGANPTRADGSQAKFSSFQYAGLEIKDGYGKITRNRFNFLEFFNPGIKKVQVLTDGPYKPNETVRAAVFTNDYALTKNTYQINLDISILNGEGTVTTWRKIEIDNTVCEVENCEHSGTFGPRTNTEGVHRYNYYVGVVEFQASNLRNSNPEIAVRNEEQPEQTTKKKTLPNVDVLEKAGTVRTNVSVDNLRYLVEQPVMEYATAHTEEERNEYLEDGYSVEHTETNAKFTLEKYTKVADAEYRTKTKIFHDQMSRDTFILRNFRWISVEPYSVTKHWTTTATEWRNRRGGEGTFTGDTRRVKTDSAEYRVLKKYQYDRTVQKTRTRYERRTRWVPVTKTGTKTVNECNRFIGCYWTTETYTYHSFERESYLKRVTDTYYVTKTETYWARSKMHPSHDYTGDIRRKLISPAEYTTQYKYEYEEEHSKERHYYPVQKQVQVKKSQYEWKVYDTVDQRSTAELATRRQDDRRIGNEVLTTEWQLSKQTGTERKITSSYENADNVIETRATVTGDVNQKLIHEQKIIFEHKKSFRFMVEYDGEATVRQIINDEKKWS